jgi:hypothetical protein
VPNWMAINEAVRPMTLCGRDRVIHRAVAHAAAIGLLAVGVLAASKYGLCCRKRSIGQIAAGGEDEAEHRAGP